uniref:Uncharacterized protein n=1 Tax=Anguilla anguilla TaxID=7936 RepID=A0A0E9SXE9_ANGAN
MPCSSSQQQCPTWESKLQPRSYKSSSLHNPASPCRRDFRKEREGPCYSLPPFFTSPFPATSKSQSCFSCAVIQKHSSTPSNRGCNN